ncbi:tyrosine-type recombinase/integrase [Paracoccus aestuariivivens]|uniref:Tyrosine-type recombinase/integrase n=1 Tax=Paracoccus aestuariivivens TaxID=1820333 RepID=A0A6L6JDP6_9RHOB|nr:tyrosine-type recombinase/integrase [Paracoccus aestuariivivens]MTH79345.1 tyrosine-type recombinase/integrase [Paracoccus aestuariivivens]
MIHEAADLARRLTAISEFCFYVECDVSPEVMTQILDGYCRFEIETAIRIHAATPTRSRAQAEASLVFESAAREALRDAVLRCDRKAAYWPIRATAEQLGLEIREEDPDYDLLADRMLRCMLDVSTERENRARARFSGPGPWMSAALAQIDRPVEGRETAPQSAIKTAACPAQDAAPPAPDNAVAAKGAPPPPITEAEQAKSPDPIGSAAAKRPEASAMAVNTIIAMPAVQDVPVKQAAETEKASEERKTEYPRVVEIPAALLHFKPAESQNAAPAETPSPGILDLWDDWFQDRINGIVTQGAYTYSDEGSAKRFRKESETTKSTRKLIDSYFGNAPVLGIKPEQWHDFTDLLRRLPQNHGRSPKNRAMGLQDLVKAADAKEKRQKSITERKIAQARTGADDTDEARRKAKIARIAPRTFQRHQSNVSAPLDYAVGKGRITHNPYAPFVMPEKIIENRRKGLPDSSRQLWGDDFQVLLRTRKWSSPKTLIEDAIYWLPIMARLHGMRSEEMLQLKPSNIRSERGIWFIEIERGFGQSVKSDNGRRTIPIHKQLIELGFLELVERQRRLGHPRIFSRASRSKSQKATYTANFTKSFAFYMRSVGCYDPRRDLHDLRTSFHSDLVAAKVPDTARRFLMGHANSDVGITNYLPEGFGLETLRDYIEMIRIDLSAIKQRFAKEAVPGGLRLATDKGVPVERNGKRRLPPSRQP